MYVLEPYIYIKRIIWLFHYISSFKDSVFYFEKSYVQVLPANTKFYLFLLSSKMEDILWDSLTDSYTGFPMAITAENLAEQYKISKEDCDKYALQTQQRWKAGEFKRAYAINTS